MSIVVHEDSDNMFAWDRIEETYEIQLREDVLVQRFTINDDGSTVDEMFDGGVLRGVTRVDGQDDGGAKRWDSVESLFDETGELTSKTVVLDNGVTRVSSFADGVLRQSVTTDVDDAKNYQSVTAFFDEDGLMTNRTTVLDNGVQKIQVFDAGAAVMTLQQDVLDARSWSAKSTFFDENGERALTGTIFDNGDQTMNIYDDGQLVERRMLDGDDSHNWTGRVLVYDAEGGVVSDTRYDTEAELPQDFFAPPEPPVLDLLG